jgi:Dehydrogenases with different specificities (related to short-chain alcohol dehydrogenases)
MDLSGKVVVITGAGGTLCSVAAREMARQGAKVVLVGRTPEKLEKTASEITEIGGVCRIEPCDATDSEGISSLAEKVLSSWGPCNILINGAGGNNVHAMTSVTSFDPREITDGKPADMVGFFNIDADMFESVLKINTLGTVIPSKIFGKHMAAAGGGSIINFASMNSYCPLTKVPAYAMSKAAIVNFTQWLSAYLAPANIRVNAIAPGFFINERSKAYLGTPETGLTPRGEGVMAHTPMKKFGNPEQLLGALNWLIDDEAAAFVTGITVPVDGGFLALSGV